MRRKIQSVLELAKYRVGNITWWVTLRPIAPIQPIVETDEWMNGHHPKTPYVYGLRKSVWNTNIKLPQLQHMDFDTIMAILTSKLVVEQFVICDIIRSFNTGEFFYENDQNEWMPETSLFHGKKAATNEQRRIKKLIKRWSGYK